MNEKHDKRGRRRGRSKKEVVEGGGRVDNNFKKIRRNK